MVGCGNNSFINQRVKETYFFAEGQTLNTTQPIRINASNINYACSLLYRTCDICGGPLRLIGWSEAAGLSVCLTSVSGEADFLPATARCRADWLSIFPSIPITQLHLWSVIDSIWSLQAQWMFVFFFSSLFVSQLVSSSSISFRPLIVSTPPFSADASFDG